MNGEISPTSYEAYIRDAQHLERRALEVAKQLAVLEARGHIRECYDCHLKLHNLYTSMAFCYEYARALSRGAS